MLEYSATSHSPSTGHPLPAVDPEVQGAGHSLYTMVVALGMVLLIMNSFAYWEIKLTEGEPLLQETDR